MRHLDYLNIYLKGLHHTMFMHSMIYVNRLLTKRYHLYVYMYSL